jgi:hypothetical protein
VPIFVPTQFFNSSEDGVLGRMHVTGRDCDRAVASDPRQGPRIAAGFTESCEKGMAEAIQHKTTNNLVGDRAPLVRELRLAGRL